MATKLKNAFWVILAGIVVYWAATTLSGSVFGGPLDPPAPPAETQKTQIDALPYTISSSGSYILMQDLTCPSCASSGDNGITIEVNDVDLDLNGFTLRGPGSASGSGDGINVDSTGSNVAVYNGTVREWGGDGVDALFAGGATVSDLRARSNGGRGITIGAWALLTDCIARGNGSHGIEIGAGGATIDNCTAANNGLAGIHVDGYGSTVRNCTADENTLSGIDVVSFGSDARIENCTITGNGDNGIFVATGGAQIKNNLIANSGSRGIHVTSGASSGEARIEGNNFQNNQGAGLDVDATFNLIIKNDAGSNTGPNYSIVSGNTVGPILNTADPIASTNPWANFEN